MERVSPEVGRLARAEGPESVEEDRRPIVSNLREPPRSVARRCATTPSHGRSLHGGSDTVITTPHSPRGLVVAATTPPAAAKGSV